MKKGWQIFWHVLFWGCLVSLFIFIVSSNSKVTTVDILVTIGFFSCLNIGLFYFNYLVLIPAYLDKNNYRKYALAVVLTIILAGVVKYGVRVLIYRYWPGLPDSEPLRFWPYFVSSLFASVIFITLSITLQFTTDWFQNERVQRDLENQRLTAELALLKSQINPHFLFNSLNSIYSLAYQRADNTPEAILKLSEIMRYMLYECNDNKVDLTKELQYLQNYIDLQKIRLGKTACVDFVITGEVNNQRIVPLLLIAFIENAFKHGIANNAATPIQLKIAIENNRLDFFMQNKKHVHNRDAAGGIGLNNVKRRLNLLYPNQYQLKVNDTVDTYTCELSLIL
ncbi:histidine kinase [Mucilaginibacter robiniae]|uniref:Histidine kinase n=1 Tax=Mucilaginibacter robiniae TaxID=2728022 RepID=A0A7L5DWX8_9SPHI|nr:sensor histidine kinase [Mucilaginibacter robiniae]QJD95535.1 histidine kinase [Mucilaginibacter robiniae]